jgi:hypothetical protein
MGMEPRGAGNILQGRDSLNIAIDSNIPENRIDIVIFLDICISNYRMMIFKNTLVG